MNLKKLLPLTLIFCLSGIQPLEAVWFGKTDKSTDDACQQLRAIVENEIEKHEMAYLKYSLKRRLKKAQNWLKEQPKIVQLPIIYGSLLVATAAVYGCLYTIKNTLEFIPSLIGHPLTTIRGIVTGQPQQILGTLGTAATAAAVTHVYSQDE